VHEERCVNPAGHDHGLPWPDAPTAGPQAPVEEAGARSAGPDVSTAAPDPPAGEPAGPGLLDPPLPRHPGDEVDVDQARDQPRGAPQHASGNDVALSMNPRTAVLLLSAFVTVVLVAAAWLMPVHYAVLRPGPALNTLGSENGKALISVSGRQTYATSGALDLTTVSVVGGPGGHVELYEVISGWLDPTVAVVPEEAIFPPGQTAQQSEEQNQQEMVSSQESATAAAMASLGIKVPAKITITEVDGKAPAAAVLKAKDVLVAVNGVTIDGVDALHTGLAKIAPGEVAAMTVLRDGTRRDVEVRTREGEDGKVQIGVFIDATFDFPFDVKIQIEDIGGPSAGTMFALGIIDKLTPGELTGGKKIAGTGTMDADGTVGPIGGIRQKLVGARRAGAGWFLAPADNCAEVVGHVPDGLSVVRIATLDEARAAVEKIGTGSTGSLPSCTG
jgi:PDZ domain-containing protein